MTSDVWRATRPLRVARRALPYAYYFCRHLAIGPYRAGLPVPPGSTRVRAAVYDAVMNLLLDGYADLVGH